MRFEILKSLPTYGPMYIPVTEDNRPYYSEGVPVKFYTHDETTWVANFEPGWTALTEILELEDSPNLIVIARGLCYLMNPESTITPLAVFGTDYECLLEATKGRFVLQSSTCLTIIEPTGAFWHSERISWDGIKELKIEGVVVTGISYDPMHDSDEWVPFSFDIETKELTGGSYYRYNRDTKKKPWWKTWF